MTDRALAAYRDSAAGLDIDALAPAAADELASATNRLAGLNGLRQDVNRGSIAPGPPSTPTTPPSPTCSTPTAG